MERHLTTREAWDVWLELLRARPDRERALDARASLLFEARGCDPDLLLRTMLDAARIEDQLDAAPATEPVAGPVAEPTAPRTRWVVPGLAILAAAGLAVGVLLPGEPATVGAPPDVVYRGEASAVPGGTVALEQDGRALAKVPFGRGVRPAVDVGDAPLLLRWSPERPDAGGRVVAWQIGEDGTVASLDGRPGEVTAVGPGGVPFALVGRRGSVVVATLPGSADAVEVAARIGSGRSAVEPLGDVRVVAFDLERR